MGRLQRQSLTITQPNHWTCCCRPFNALTVLCSIWDVSWVAHGLLCWAPYWRFSAWSCKALHCVSNELSWWLQCARGSCYWAPLIEEGRRHFLSSSNQRLNTFSVFKLCKDLIWTWWLWLKFIFRRAWALFLQLQWGGVNVEKTPDWLWSLSQQNWLKKIMRKKGEMLGLPFEKWSCSNSESLFSLSQRKKNNRQLKNKSHSENIGEDIV